MAKAELFTDHLLRIEVSEDTDSVAVKWTGKSTNRRPSTFITPVLTNALQRANDISKTLVLDFRELEYMNSSTITPIIKVLERAKKGTSRIAVLFQESLRWQNLSFSALRVFETKDRRVEIRGI